MKKRKKAKRTCDCRRRKKGNPKVGTGPCYCYGYDSRFPSMRSRTAAR
jgi:hypothetical protein